MTPSDLLGVAVLSGVFGFAVYAGSYALHVWRRRNGERGGRPGAGDDPAARAAARCGRAAVGCGAVVVVLALAFREAVDREGTLVADGIFALRVPEGMRVESVLDAEAVAPGAFLASFQAVEPGTGVLAAQLRVERDRLERERVLDRLEREERLRAHEAEGERLGGEIDAVAARLDLARAQLASSDQLHGVQALSENELAERRAAVRVLEADLRRLERFRASVERERRDAEGALGEAQTLARTHHAELERELDRASRLVVAAPFAGRVAYVSRSPQAVFGEAPLLVVARPGAFRLRVRLPEAEVGALTEATDPTIEWAEAGIRRRFPGLLVLGRVLPADPGYALAELRCEPPPEAVREVASGRPVKAALRWGPPLTSLPLLRLGVLLIAAGAFAACFAAWRRLHLAAAAPAAARLKA